MGFSQKQIRALQRPLDARYLRTRELNGRQFPYIEGWHAIAEANRIFGFDGWDRETIESRCVIGREIRGSYLAIYTARVRVTVHTDGVNLVREGSGSGEGRSASPGEAHEIAFKAAETDATKRALATFGKPFGLALYLNGRGARKRQGAHSPSPPGKRTSPPGPDSPPHTSRDPQQDAGQDEHRGMIDQSNVDSPPAQNEDPRDQVRPNIPTLVPGSAIDKSALRLPEPRRVRDKRHLVFVASQPCLICGRAPSDAHHLRFAQPRGLGRKVSDEFTVPLCRTHHRQVHEHADEAAWWSDLDIDALEIAKSLWEQRRANEAKSSVDAKA